MGFSYEAIVFFATVFVAKAVTNPVFPESFHISAAGSIEGLTGGLGSTTSVGGHAHGGRVMRHPDSGALIVSGMAGVANALASDKYDPTDKEGEKPKAKPSPTPSPPPDVSKSIEYRGNVEVARVPLTSSEVVKLEAETEECMRDTPVSVCWERFGSYGIRRLLALDYDEIDGADYTRPDWMANDKVQAKRLFDLTFPGTHHSGAFAVTGKEEQTIGKLPYGVLTQNLNITEQLMMGVRALHMHLAFGTKSDQLYCSKKYLLTQLKSVLAELMKFLYENPKEVVVISAWKDPTAEDRYQKALLDDDSDAERVPGQRVHEAIFEATQDMLGVYETLSKLPATEDWTNPTIASLVTHNVRVIYFWEGQQVLCITGEKCNQAAGYVKGAAGNPLGFGQPMVLNTRVDASSAKRKTIEPACMLRSETLLANTDAASIVQQVKRFSSMLQEKYAAEHRPSCFPAAATIPDVHKPTIFYSADAVFTPQAQEAVAQMQLLRTAKAVFSRGEGFTIQGEAERLNYLLLAWYMKKGYQSLFTQPNIVSMDFPAPLLVHRIIEAQQDLEDCGWAVYCVPTGGCWAATMSPDDGGKCLNEADVLDFLRGQAGMDWRWRMAICSFFAGIMLWLLCICGRCRGFLWAFGGQYKKPELTTAEAMFPCIGMFGASSAPPSEAAATEAKDLPVSPAEQLTSAGVTIEEAPKIAASQPPSDAVAAPVQQQQPQQPPPQLPPPVAAPVVDPFAAPPAAASATAPVAAPAQANVDVEPQKVENEF